MYSAHDEGKSVGTFATVQYSNQEIQKTKHTSQFTIICRKPRHVF